jgi:CRP/FNR family transcriptional regulator, cyclic AMP receptor protein
MSMRRVQQPEDLAGMLAGFPFFEGVESSELERLATLARCHEYPRNNILSYHGDPAGVVCLVVSGRVKIILTNEEGREVIVQLLGPGGIFGLTAALDGGEQPGTAITIEKARIARFNGTAFLSWTNSSEGARCALVRELTRRNRELAEKVGAHVLMSAKDRLIHTLLDIADTEGQSEPGDECITFTRPTHKELAHRIGSSREVVSRLLAELRASEMLEAEDGRVIRLPLSALVLRDD